jgi:hypothetical protein
MKSSTRWFRLVSALLFIALLSYRGASAQDDPTLRVGDSVEDVRPRAEFLLDAEAGQTVTLRWEGRFSRVNCGAPFVGAIIHVVTEVTNAEGNMLEQIGLMHTAAATLQVYTLEGTAPYAISTETKCGSDITLSVLDGDMIPRIEQPALSIGDMVTIDAMSVGYDQLLVFPLNVQAGDVFTVDAHFIESFFNNNYRMYVEVVRDANGHVVASDFSGPLPRIFNMALPVYTVAGALPYRLELAALPSYLAGYDPTDGQLTPEISYSVGLQSGNTAIDVAGPLAIGTRIQGVLDGNPDLYTFDAQEGDVFTFRPDFPELVNYYFFNAEQEHADTIQFSTYSGDSMVLVMRMAGPPPYWYYIEGEGSYTLLLEEGDTLDRNEMGRLAPGGVVQRTVPPDDNRLDYIALDVNPESTVTLNWGVPQTEFYIQDSAGLLLDTRNEHWTDGYGIFDLSEGTPPFILLMDAKRYSGQSYTFTLAEGESPLSPNAATTASTSANTQVATEGGTQSGADTDTDGVACTVTASSTVNQRSGPGTSFAIAGTLAGGTSAAVEGQATGADGFVWWRLGEGIWVRSDVVNAAGNCESVPIVQG